MSWRYTFLFFLLIISFSGCQNGCRQSNDSPLPKPTKWVALTLDDAPITHYFTYPDSSLRRETVEKLIAAIHKHNAPTTIFAIGRESELPEQKVLLQRWVKAGVEFGNHTHNHQSFNEHTTESWRREVQQTQDILKPLSQIKYFRFPFLQEGETVEREQEGRALLAQIGLQNAPITIGIDDWAFNEKYMEAELKQDWATRYEVGQAYMSDVKKRIAFWDSVAVTLEKRNIKHVIMFHANRINRDYLDQILAYLKNEEYGFISLEEAYQDPIYQQKDLWATKAGVSFLEHIKQTRLLGSAP